MWALGELGTIIGQLFLGLSHVFLSFCVSGSGLDVSISWRPSSLDVFHSLNLSRASTGRNLPRVAVETVALHVLR